VIADWLKKPSAIEREKRLMAGFDDWAEAQPHDDRTFPGMA